MEFPCRPEAADVQAAVDLVFEKTQNIEDGAFLNNGVGALLVNARTANEIANECFYKYIDENSTLFKDGKNWSADELMIPTDELLKEAEV